MNQLIIDFINKHYKVENTNFTVRTKQTEVLSILKYIKDHNKWLTSIFANDASELIKKYNYFIWW